MDNGDKELLIRHDEQIRQMRADIKDLARMVTEAKGYNEGWWQSRRDSLIEDVKQEITARQERILRWMATTVGAAVIYAVVTWFKNGSN